MKAKVRTFRYLWHLLCDAISVPTVKYAIAYVAALLCMGTLGYWILEGRSPVDAFYTTVLILTGVGCANPPTTPAGEIFTIGLLAVGLGALIHIISRIFAALLRGDVLLRIKESDAMARIERMRDHVVVCGYGKKGREIARNLGKHGFEVVVVDKDSEKCDRAFRDGHLAVQGDVTSEETLLKAGVERAQAVALVTDSDETNVFACVLVRDLNPDAWIVAAARSKTGARTLQRAGADEVVRVYEAAGIVIANRLMDPLSFLVTVSHPLEDTFREFREIIRHGGIVVDVRYHIPPLPEPLVKDLWVEDESDVKRRLEMHEDSETREALERLHRMSDDVHSHRIIVRREEDKEKIVEALRRLGFLIGVDMTHGEVLKEVFEVEA
ncbi:NAD-binding protein [Methanopyrus sp. SNP6]|uniref:NAD-binding protein n=1 Tax=Methanopyrus sp. SNP6 TaxID=1937005 RepID=UPI0011E5E5A8|nr:NAD-binding protein [Methanopyrus sp. SNP6]